MKLMRLFKTKPQSGDTLVEVVIATIIIGVILASAYSLSTKAFQLGQSGKERSQAAQLMQEQAEALRSQRDSNSTWSAFLARQSSVTGSDQYYLRKGTGWQVTEVSGSVSRTACSGAYQPGTEPGSSVPQYYRLAVTNLEKSASRLRAKVMVCWQRLGGGPIEYTELYLNLVDQQLPQLELSIIAPNRKVG
jgi:prepilin-type N-terminal cleavage/methylation domain-containing protein